MKAIRRNRLQSLANTNLIDAARVDGQRSSAFLAWPQFPEAEFSQTTRENVLKKTRLLTANLGIVSAMVKKVGRYAVGSGLYPIPATADLEWNEDVRVQFTEWMNHAGVCDALGRWTFPEAQKWVAESLFSEGEAFAALVNSAQVDAPQVQMIDPMEVRYVGPSGAPPGSLEGGDLTNWDGCWLNKNSRVVAYSVQTAVGGEFAKIDAANMIHLADFKRPNQVRALSPFHAGANSAIDALDLKGLETATIKLHSLLGVIFKKSSGRGIGEGGLSGTLTQLFQTSPDGATATQSAVGENFFGGAATLHLGPDDDVKLLTSERPSVNLIEFLEWLYRDVSVSTGLPLEIVWNLSDLGGVNSRVCLADAQFLFDLIQKKVVNGFCQRVYTWWVACQIKRGVVRECADPRWWACHWQGPAKLSIDRNQTASDIARVEAGLDTLQDYFSARGADWLPKQRQRILEVKTRMEECKKMGVPYLTAFPAKPGVAPMDAPEDFSDAKSAPAPQQQAA